MNDCAEVDAMFYQEKEGYDEQIVDRVGHPRQHGKKQIAHACRNCECVVVSNRSVFSKQHSSRALSARRIIIQVANVLQVDRLDKQNTRSKTSQFMVLA